MESEAFDRVARLVSTRRRSVVAAFGAVVAGAGLTGPADVAAKKCGKGKKRCQGKCIKKSQCCSTANCLNGQTCVGRTCTCPAGKTTCPKGSDTGCCDADQTCCRLGQFRECCPPEAPVCCDSGFGSAASGCCPAGQICCPPFSVNGCATSLALCEIP